MATSRQVRCNQCGSVSIVPAEVRVFECTVCHGLTQIRPTTATGPWSQVYNSFQQFGGRLRSFVVNTIMPSTFSSVNTNPPGYYGTPQFEYYPQPQYSLMPSFNVFGPKRAVLCGIRYLGMYNSQLKGTVNDVKNMYIFLTTICGFPIDSIVILTDELGVGDRLRMPTKYNIQMAMRWLVDCSESGDSLVFHFAGHGAQEKNIHGEWNELDGYDEAICPVDWKENGIILDNEINATIVRPLPHGAKLHAIIDSCHSGTVLDLPYVWSIRESGYWTWNHQYHGFARPDKDTNGGIAICISGCDDDQLSNEIPGLSRYGYENTAGAFTYSFIQTMLNDPGLSYGHLLTAMRSTIRGISNNTHEMMFDANYWLLPRQDLQEPQLSCSVEFDVYTTPVVL